MPVIALIKERKSPPDKRVALTPIQCREAMDRIKDLRIIVESSNIRAFIDQEYLDKGIEVLNDVSDAEILIGVKEVPMEALIPNKTYLFFSHTIKAQPYNRELLRTILKKNIRLIDHETLEYENGSRVLGFGRYAGIVGAFNAFRTWGIKNGTFDLKPAHLCSDRKEMEAELAKLVLPENFRIVLTGSGRVAGGVIEILKLANIENVPSEEFLTRAEGRVHTQLDVGDYNNIPPNGSKFNKKEFYSDPSGYSSGLLPYLKEADIYISGHYWDPRSPILISAQDLENDTPRLKVVADISCDIAGPIACTIRPSTIDDPIYGYHRHEHVECDSLDPDAIAVMAVDNLPCELPRDASEGFGAKLGEVVLPELVKASSGLIDRSTMTKAGKLSSGFEYLQDFVDRTE